jgi:hypothetical protein
VSVLNPKAIQDQNRERQMWAAAGADWAYFLVQFLRGQRRLPIQSSEIKTTQLYKRSSPAERQALEMVCDEPEVPHLDPESKRALADRDAWLMLFADGKNLGHADRVAQIAEIPVLVEAREKGDRQMFPTAHYPITPLFDWIFTKAR